MKLISENLNEFQDFTREENNILKKLGIGVEHFIKKITSEDLELLTYYIEHGENEFTKIFLSDLNNEEIKTKLKKIKKIFNILNNHIMIGEIFDWKESEKMMKYIDKNIGKNKKYQYAYNGIPNSDGCGIIFSDMKLPNAELLQDTYYSYF
ncbi:MAG: hypothetical protein PHF86_00680 [Candidatus Nanoarchaeia archaeon]|nr:hypothetical protein [Candidatus Nanoarchaeia archaeon]